MAKSRNVANLIAANLLPASNTITTDMLVDGAVTTSKLASNSVNSGKIDYSVSALLPLTITGITVTDGSYVAQADTALSPSGGYIKLTGTGFAAGCQVYVNNTPATASIYVSATEVRAQIPAFSAGYYHIYVQNSNGQAGLRVNGLYISTSPTWSSSGSISGSVDVPFALQLAASSDTSVAYSLAAGSTLPTGMSLTSLGYLSGTVSGINTTTIYSFDIVVTDSENQTSSRTFTLTITVSEPYFPYTSLLLLGNNAGTTTQNNTFVDSSVNAVTPTRFGNVTQGSFSPFSQTGWSTYFNGTTDYLTLSTNAVFSFGTGDFTIELWLYPTSAFASLTRMMSSYTGGFILMPNTSGNIIFGSYGVATIVTTTGTVSLNTWTHVAIVRSSGTTTVYLNGSSSGSGADSTNYSNTGLFIGTDNGSNKYNGHISNLRIVKGQALYTANFTPSTSALTSTSQGATAANVSVLTSQSNRHVDNSINNLAITVAGGSPAIQSASPFTPSGLYSQSTTGGSLYIPGNGSMTNYLSLASSNLFSFGTGDFTIEFWVYPTTSPSGSWNTFLTIGTNGGGQEIRISQNINGAGFGYLIPPNSGITDVYVGNGTLTLNAWHHLALVRIGTVVSFYRNGTRVTSTTGVSFNFTNTTAFRIGTSQAAYTSDTGFTGYMTDLRIIKGTGAYTGNFTPPSAPLLTSQSSSGNLAPVSSGLTSLLLKGTNAGIFDSTAKNVVETIGSVATQTTYYKYGGASISFPGTGSFLFAPSNLGFAFGTGDYTIECWIYLSVLGTYRRIWWFSDDNDNTNVNASNQIQFGGASQTAITGSTLSANTWYHLAYVRSSGSGKLYLDGAQVGSTTANSYNSSTRSFYVGATNTGANPWSGYIDDLRVTKGVARYTANFTAPTGELTAN